MLRVNTIRLIKTVFNSSSFKNGVTRYKDYRYICRILSTESVAKSNFDSKRGITEQNKDLSSFSEAAKEIGLGITNLSEFVKNDALLNIGSDQLLKNAKTLLDFGFDSETVKGFIKEYPSLFNLKNLELERLLLLWQQLGLGEDLIIELLSKHPQFIEIMGPDVKDRISQLLPYFQKEKTVMILLLNTPSVIYENWGALKAKLDFLHSHNIPMNKVAKCTALALSLLEIKTRFTFLERAGVYRKVIDLEKKDLTINNATVNNILCSSDELFAKTIAKLTLEEFEAFIELYRLEQEALDEEEYVEEDDSR